MPWSAVSKASTLVLFRIYCDAEDCTLEAGVPKANVSFVLRDPEGQHAGSVRTQAYRGLVCLQDPALPGILSIDTLDFAVR